ncbi:sulfite exporter TauE/SafE family protein [Sphingopyxis macrogoltabida]|uniref:Probable membrane transporter protein n=1 Tax=Sphingopyxis macrogoltabida TaxID=33050 RepID=A0AAC9FHS4_SPHMC|nr:sulfite exporter TauE/SafE family protein [Sphingopyxis macrogoltabida]ALJ16693.1 periplasmic nitrate reductase NapA [Sphingopyxis macrogoltabida]AMU92918.1 hypothetical protein ATM17_40275 [Sphingopyxis macrogoltabida]
MIAALIVLCAFLTSILSGIFGMAGGLILMGLLAWLLPITTALALHGMIQFASNLWRVILHRRYVAWRVLITFGMGAIAAMAFFALITFEPAKLYVFLGLGLMPILIWLPERWLRLEASNPWQSLVGGFVSTGLSLVSGVSGPVTDLLFVRTRLNRHQVVATKAVMQAIGHASKVVVYGGVLLSPAARAAIPLLAGTYRAAPPTGDDGAIFYRLMDGYAKADGGGMCPPTEHECPAGAGLVDVHDGALLAWGPSEVVFQGAFAGGGGILRQARPDSRREILLVAAFYGRARKATAQFYPAMATHFEGVWPNAPILNEAERTPKSLCRFIRFQHGQPNLCGTSRSGPAFDRRVN